MTVVAMIFLLFLAMPFIGLNMMKEESNRGLGFVVFILGLVMYGILFGRR